LDISKIEAGKFELVPVEYDIPSLINDTITQSIMRIGDKLIRFILDIDENLPSRLYGDDLRVKQALNNLLSNAFKYTKEGTVELSLRCERVLHGSVLHGGDGVMMTARVSDTGVGIKKEDLENLFADYTKLDITSNRETEGTGLGLPLTKKVVEMMGGSISVESEYGKGSVFTVKMLQRHVTDSVIGAEVTNSLKSFHYSDQKRRNNSRISRVSLPYAKVLVVDDVATNLDVARGMLKPYGMQVDCASSGQEAIDAIRAENVRYNAVFMDHMMPEMDGIEAARIIREIGTEYANTIPIIALTANAIVGNKEMFLDKGFQAFISKPVEISRLDAVVREWVRDKELEKTLAQVNVSGNVILDTRSGQDRRGESTRRSGTDRRASVTALGRKIDGLDMDKGIDLFGGDEESYVQILRSYTVNTAPLLEKAQTINRENAADYAIIVHGIKGSSRSICADAVGDMAEALEEAAKKGNIDFVLDNNAAFIEAARKLIGDLDELLQLTDLQATIPKSEKPVKDKPDSELLNRLMTACGEGDIDAVDTAIKELESCEYTSDDGLATWLLENAEKMNYGEMAERIKEFLP
jgi:CheY-like chemotaxis protein/HPt (histidine-containing phosphotransfer) domain-containing protein